LVDRLAEFKYGGIPKETFAPILGSQDKPNMLYYYPVDPREKVLYALSTRKQRSV
jgi:hypothetical protein